MKNELTELDSLRHSLGTNIRGYRILSTYRGARSLEQTLRFLAEIPRRGTDFPGNLVLTNAYNPRTVTFAGGYSVLRVSRWSLIDSCSVLSSMHEGRKPAI